MTIWGVKRIFRGQCCACPHNEEEEEPPPTPCDRSRVSSACCWGREGGWGGRGRRGGREVERKEGRRGGREGGESRPPSRQMRGGAGETPRLRLRVRRLAVWTRRTGGSRSEPPGLLARLEGLGDFFTFPIFAFLDKSRKCNLSLYLRRRVCSNGER